MYAVSSTTNLWSQTQMMLAPTEANITSTAGARFGLSVTITSIVAAVGAPFIGVVYLYELTGSQSTTFNASYVSLSGSGATSACFGCTVGSAGPYVVIGAPNATIARKMSFLYHRVLFLIYLQRKPLTALVPLSSPVLICHTACGSSPTLSTHLRMCPTPTSVPVCRCTEITWW